MANVVNIEKKLLKLINNKDSFAIALTGEWGIGKTRFWNNFYEENHTDLGVNKYSYVSLFGIDSIEALKFEIALSTHETTQKKDYLSGLKGIFKKSLDVIDLPKLEGTGVTLSLGKGLISSAITSLIGDTLICIDDIERLSKNIDIKDIMGLVNHLSLEKNCKVVVILHEDKADKDFREYKEKVFDEVLTLDNSLSIIKKIVVNNELFSIYEFFYQTMDIKNIRFYQRVERTLKAILDNSDDDLSFISKKQILEALLIIRMAHDMPSTFDDTIDFDFFVKSFSSPRVDELRGYDLDLAFKSDEDRLDDKEKVEVARKFKLMDDTISQFYSYFELSGWSKIITSLLIDLDTESEIIEELSRSDKLTETQLENDREKQELMTEYHSLSPEHGFNQRIFDNIEHRIDREMLPNLSFYYNILRKNGASDLSNQLKELVEKYIEVRVVEGSEQGLMESYYLNHSNTNDIFYNFLQQTIKKHKRELTLNNNADTMSKIFMRFCKHGNHSEDFFKAIQNINKEIFSHVIWQPLVDGSSRMLYIRELLKHPAFRVDIAKFKNADRIDTAIWDYQELVNAQKPSPFIHQPVIIQSKLNEVKQWTLELLQERIVEKPNSKAAIDHLLELTNNLENI
ncbi:P-loop NTPase fold protein [Psychrobacter sp. DAB_AL62B]|uniref:P-loop NTPase fold protein n=1 Tax=Psychrobacter sp. DAB_AL62B TaxID=1028420 RepID=UPI0023813253|nr:P-loop NTPase fold protein [Psychrobacter sp. DAB_AL62B]MDE4455006.1 NTPase [Psychrobacter sp. DAB_AL62B]